jgi:hypothetical protein
MIYNAKRITPAMTNAVVTDNAIEKNASLRPMVLT